MRRYEGPVEIDLTVNSLTRRIVVRPGDTLLRTVREVVGLTGTKMGCENGDCGSCTVLIDGVPVKSCCVLTLDAVGKSITTIEGLQGNTVQQGFIEEYGFQCGFCTSGQIVNASALLRHNPNPDPETVREWMESNLCRCTGYEGIRKAIAYAAGTDKDSPQTYAGLSS